MGLVLLEILHTILSDNYLRIDTKTLRCVTTWLRTRLYGYGQDYSLGTPDSSGALGNT
jgi:hypothetical protein